MPGLSLAMALQVVEAQAKFPTPLVFTLPPGLPS